VATAQATPATLPSPPGDPIAVLEARIAGWLAEESGRAVGASRSSTAPSTAALAVAWEKMGDAVPLYWGGPVPATTLVHGCPASAAAGGAATPPECAGEVSLPSSATSSSARRLFLNAGALAAAGEGSPVVPFIGCASWAPGQLEAELAAGRWLVVEAGDDLLRMLELEGEGGGEAVWKRVLSALGPPYAAWAGLPRSAVSAAAAAAAAAAAM